MMARRKISLGELAEKIDITPANLSILKTGKAKAIRFSTLEAICKVDGCAENSKRRCHRRKRKGCLRVENRVSTHKQVRVPDEAWLRPQ